MTCAPLCSLGCTYRINNPIHSLNCPNAIYNPAPKLRLYRNVKELSNAEFNALDTELTEVIRAVIARHDLGYLKMQLIVQPVVTIKIERE